MEYTVSWWGKLFPNTLLLILKDIGNSKFSRVAFTSNSVKSCPIFKISFSTESLWKSSKSGSGKNWVIHLKVWTQSGIRTLKKPGLNSITNVSYLAKRKLSWNKNPSWISISFLFPLEAWTSWQYKTPPPLSKTRNNN